MPCVHSRGSVSSEDVVSLRSGEVSDGHHEDSLSTVTAGSSSAELRRAGSRRPVYLTEDTDSMSVRDGVPDPMPDSQVRETQHWFSLTFWKEKVFSLFFFLS